MESSDSPGRKLDLKLCWRSLCSEKKARPDQVRRMNGELKQHSPSKGLVEKRSIQKKISARNVFEGKIIEIKEGATTSHTVLDVKGLHLTASTTNEAVEEICLKAGQTASAAIMSSDNMIAVAQQGSGKLIARRARIRGRDFTI